MSRDPQDERIETLGNLHRFSRKPAVDARLGPGAQLVVLTGPKLGERYVIGDEVVIGREIDDGIDVDDPGISRRHAQITRSPTGAYMLRDCGSRNGTLLNGVAIAEAPISFGDRITVGVGTVLLFARHGRVEDQLAQVQKLQALGELAGGIAHDFNNLLGTILTNVTFLAGFGAATQDELAAALGDIESAARRGVGLTSQLLGFTRRGRTEAEALDLGELIQEAVRLLRRTLNRGVDVRTRLEPDIGVVGAPSRLFQVLMNLCINAGDAMPRGGTLTLAARRRDISENEQLDLAPGHYVELTVTDTGVGMSPTTAEQIFDPFFTTKPRGRGTGLGLAMVYNIVQEHGGAVTAESEQGMGSRFSVYLPWIELDSAQSAAEPRPLARAQISGRTVLFADDEPGIRSTIQRLLERSGVRVIAACDGVEALQMFAEADGDIDLVVLDLDMPGMDGAQAYEVMRGMDSEVNVLISSGFIDADREDQLLADGVQGFLPKPYDAETLLDTLADALANTTIEA